MIHRDIKPENLLLTQDQRKKVPYRVWLPVPVFVSCARAGLKVTDFGISKEMRRRLASKPAAITEPYVMTGKTGSKRYGWERQLLDASREC